MNMNRKLFLLVCLAAWMLPGQAQNTVESYFEKSFSGIAKDSMYQDRHDKSVDPENFKSDCQLFINDEGALCMIVKIYSMAGADYYYHLMPVL